MLKPATPTGASELDEFALRSELRDLRRQIPDQPYLNPIAKVAFDLSRQLEGGQISFEGLRALAARLMDRACVRRARGLAQRVGFTGKGTSVRQFAEYVESTIPATDDREKALAAFTERWSRARTGVVLTAHPTFGLSEALSRRMIEIAVAEEAPPEGAIGHPHRPDEVIDLEYEHRRAQDAIHNLRNALTELLNAFYTVAAAKFGDEAFKIRPHLTTIASWVGYDLDGRTDIKWSRSFLLRLEEKRAALIDLRERFLTIKHRIGDTDATQRLCRQITGKLDLAIAAVDEQAKALANVGPDGGSLSRAANVITRPDSYNIVSVEPLLALFDQLTAAVDTPQLKRSIASLAGLAAATGLGTAHIHVRINAQQLNNAFRAYVHEPWTRDLTEAQALVRIVGMIRSVTPESVNFGTLELETATAIRQLALVAQIHKHVDRDTPIRFLIAECESPATVLIAVFFAKLFGVEKLVDISPLFENARGLETGARLIQRLLAEDAYRDYVKGRGRLSIQTGFSDAGRFIGQITATLAIERLHHGLAEIIHRSGLQGVETLIFSTHGESMGRGGHPGGLSQRLQYLFTNEARRKFAQHGLTVKHETSFQGGDGFLFFGNRALTTRALATIIIDGKPPEEDDDPFYADTNLILDFLLRLKGYQEHLFEHPGYRAVLGAFGPNLLFKTGSRAVKRQHDHATAADRGDPARMRAIPNNAILQQFGYVANVVAGLGAAVGSERDRFVKLAGRSARLRTLIEMIARGKQVSSLNAMGANAVVFDAGFWALRASWGREPHLESAFRNLATYLLPDERCASINQLVHHLRLDAIDLHAILGEIGVESGKVPDDDRLELDLLQAIRLAMIMRIFILAAQLPRFSPQNDLSHQQLLGWALGLDVPDVIAFMRQAFPHGVSGAAENSKYDEPASYRPHGIDDYGRLETEILEPMEQAYEFVREIGTGISHHFGAFG